MGRLRAFDALVMPGGSGSLQAKKLEDKRPKRGSGIRSEWWWLYRNLCRFVPRVVTLRLVT